MTDNIELKGLGGWLILVGIGVVIGPFRLAAEFVPLYYGIFTDGSFEILTSPGSEAYHSLWGPLLIFETVFNLLMILASSYLIYLYFSKNYIFPKIYITIVLFSLVFIPADAWLASFVLPDEPMFDPITTKEFARTLFISVVWVPYMLISKRVKSTFVENVPNNQSQGDAKNARLV